VGDAGIGTLDIEAGGLVSNSSGFIGYDFDSTGTATVTGSGSQWNNSADLQVGRLGSGTLTVEAGGVVSNMDGFIGGEVGSTGTATVTGVGSQWNNSEDLFVGGRLGFAGGTGTLTLLPGGTVQVGGTLKIWDDGTVNLFGGTLSLLDTNSLDNTTGTYTFGSGVLELRTDAAHHSLRITAGGTLSYPGGH